MRLWGDWSVARGILVGWVGLRAFVGLECLRLEACRFWGRGCFEQCPLGCSIGFEFPSFVHGGPVSLGNCDPNRLHPTFFFGGLLSIVDAMPNELVCRAGA